MQKKKKGNHKAVTTVKHAQEVAKTLKLAASGKTERQIGEELGIHHTTAHKRIAKALAEAKGKAVDELRERAQARLDGDWERTNLILENSEISPKLALDVIETRLRIGEREAKLQGLDAATKFDLGGVMGLANLPLDQILLRYQQSGKPREQWPAALREFEARMGGAPLLPDTQQPPNNGGQK